MAAEIFTGVDAAWLHIDRPTNLAMIAGVMVLDTPLEHARFIELLQERFLIYDRFRQRVHEPLLGLGLPRWEFDPHLDMDYHVPRVQLPAPGGQVELQQLVGDLMSEPFDMRHPLWQFYYIENYQGGCAIASRLHHCIADGLALVQVLLSMTDVQPEAPARPAATDRAAAHRSGFHPLRPVRQLIGTASGAARLVMREAMLNLSDPARVTQAVSLGALTFNATSKLLLTSADQKTILNGKCGVEKRAAWSTPIPLGDVMRVGRVLHGTLNDVLLTAAAGALRRYMEKRGQDVTGVNVRAMVPMSVRAGNDLNRLGNQFGLILLSLPVGVRDVTQRLHVVKRRMDDIKGTPEAWVAFGLLSAMGLTPRQIEKLMVDFFAAKVSAVMTNVPGPRKPIYLAGQRLRHMMFWVPRAGDIGLGLSIFSYAGDVYVGIATDAGLIPDPQAIIDEFQAEMANMLRLVPPIRSPRAAPKAAVINGQCLALTKAGQPCRNKALAHAEYCGVHSKQLQLSP